MLSMGIDSAPRGYRWVVFMSALAGAGNPQRREGKAKRQD
jgi:hypothetical protein